MINPINLHSQIFSSIFQNVTGAFHNTTSRLPADTASIPAPSFSEILAQRLAENENQSIYEIRRIINEEIASNTQFTLPTLHNPAMRGLGSINLPALPMGMNTAALQGVSNPFDMLRLYSAFIGLRQST